MNYAAIFEICSFISTATGTTQISNWIEWIGHLHPVLLHFPIVFITTAALAEIIGLFSKAPIFKLTARFMIQGSAWTGLPTAILGLVFAYHKAYGGVLTEFFWWHRFGGLFTAFLAILVALLKEKSLRTNKATPYYVIGLILLVFSVTVTGYLGGRMTFHHLRLFP